MDTFPQGARTVLARTVSAEIRARIGADRSLTGLGLAREIGRSQNYVAERLRDEKAFSVDDVEAFSRYFGENPTDFVAACMRHWDRVASDLHKVLAENVPASPAKEPSAAIRQLPVMRPGGKREEWQQVDDDAAWDED